MKIISLATLVVICWESVAQNSFKPGSLIIQTKEYRGTINNGGEIKNSIECIFKDSLSRLTKYTPSQINEYKFENGNYYASKFAKTTASNQLRFAEYLIKGKKNLYYIKDGHGFHFFVDQRFDTIAEIPYQEKTIYQNGVTYRSEADIHKVFLKNYFADCPALFKQIESMHKPSFNNLIKLGSAYHKINCQDTCMKYIKKRSRFHFSLEPQVVSMAFKTGNGFTDVLQFHQTGILAYLFIPHTDDHWFFKTGFDYYSKNGALFFKVPLLFEYQFRGKFIIPKFDIGVNYYRLSYGSNFERAITIACGAGILVKLSHGIYYDLNLSSDLVAPPFNSGVFLSYLIDNGLYFKF